MSSAVGTSLFIPSSFNRNLAPPRICTQSSLSFNNIKGFRFPSLQSKPSNHGLRICCAVAKPETVEKVVEIVKKQLALEKDLPIKGDSTFTQLGADSLDTVEIVMGLEEEFGINVEEEKAQTITTIQQAADLIEDLLENKDSSSSSSNS